MEPHQVHTDYTVGCLRRRYRIERASIVPGLRGAPVRVEQRRDGSVAIAFHGRFLRFTECPAAPKTTAPPRAPTPRRKSPAVANKTPWRQGYQNMKPWPR